MSDKYRSVEHQSRSIMETSSRNPSYGPREGAARAAGHLDAVKKKSHESEKKKEAEIEDRTREAEQRKKETMSMSKEEVDEAKHTPSVFLRLANKKKKNVEESESMTEARAFAMMSDAELKQRHEKAHAEISKPENKRKNYSQIGDHIDREFEARKALKKRGITVNKPKHSSVFEDVDSPGTEARTKIKNVAREDNANPMNNLVRTKQAEIKKKVIDESGPRIDFGLSKDLINATRSILEKTTKVDLAPETNDRSDDSYQEVKKESKHTTPKTDKEKKLAALAHPKDKITHKDVLVGRGVLAKEETAVTEARGAFTDSPAPPRQANVRDYGFHVSRPDADNAKAIRSARNALGARGGNVVGVPDSHKHLMKEEVEFSDAELEHIQSIMSEEGLDEARGRPKKSGESAEGDDTHKHPIQQLTKISLAIQGSEPHFEHKDGSKSKITKQNARQILTAYNAKRTSQEKDDLADKLHASRGSMNTAIEKHVS